MKSATSYVPQGVQFLIAYLFTGFKYLEEKDVKTILPLLYITPTGMCIGIAVNVFGSARVHNRDTAGNHVTTQLVDQVKNHQSSPVTRFDSAGHVS